MKFPMIFFAISFILLLASTVNAATYDISLLIEKNVYCKNEPINVYGEIYENGVLLSSGTVDLYLYRAAAPGESEVEEDREEDVSVSGGNFASSLSSSNYGKHKITAKYEDTGGVIWESSIDFLVLPCKGKIDKLSVIPDKAVYYPGEGMEVTIEVLKKVGHGWVGIEGIPIDGTMRYPNESIISEFSCTTGDDGTCEIQLISPDVEGEYLLEVSDFGAVAWFEVLPFDVALRMLDETGQTVKTSYLKGEKAMVEVIVKPPSGSTETYIFTGSVLDKDGNVVKEISQAELSPPSYTNSSVFTIDKDFGSGKYEVAVTVSDGTSVSISTFFEVKSWELSIERKSGFLLGYTAFPGSEVTIAIKIVNLLTGESIHDNETEFDVSFDSISCNPEWDVESDAYLCSFTLPSDPGSYTLSVQATRKATTQKVKKTIMVTDFIAYASPVNEEGEPKSVFGGKEKIYVKVRAMNSTADVPITELVLIKVENEDGETVDYIQAGWDSDSKYLEWVNLSLSMLKLDNPRNGGLYRIEILVNEKAIASTKFLIVPFMVNSQTVDSEQNPKWRFSTDETIYFILDVYEAEFEETYEYWYGYGYGYGGTSGGAVVPNATIAPIHIINDQAFEEVPLSEVEYSCTLTNSEGRARCNLSTEKWSGGWYHVVWKITAEDGITGRGFSWFEARDFYIHAHAVDESGMYKWAFTPSSNITFNVQLTRESGCGSGGLSGQVTVTKILYHGKPGEWKWPPSEYEYEDLTGGLLPSTSVQEGSGNFTLSAPPDGWDSGFYSLVLEAVIIEGGNVTDRGYGTAWFDVRLWDVWATPIDPSTYSWKDKFQMEENITLFINIHPAGEWTDGVELEGKPVRISIDKIQDYSSWPPQDMDPSRYTQYPIQVNKSASYWGPLSSTEKSKYVLVIQPNEKWETGSYSVVLNVSGRNESEKGWGWFEVVSFYSTAKIVDEEGNQIWSSRGIGPLLLNLTATQKQVTTTIEEAIPVNATVKSISLWRWDQDAGLTELSYPGDINLSSAQVNGSATINMSLEGDWPSGWYHGEIILESNGNTSRARIYFEIKPFGVYLSYDYEIPSSSNFTAEIKIVEPSRWWWDELSDPLYGWYNISSIREQKWWMWMGKEIPPERYSPHSFYTNATLEIAPDNEWEIGYHTLRMKIEDESGRWVERWLSFEAIPFKVSMSYPPVIGPADDLSISLTIRDVDGNEHGANITGVYEWSWMDCGLVSSYSYTPDYIFGSGTLTISAPAEGWKMGYHSLTIELNKTLKERIWFSVKLFTGWAHGYSSKDEPVTLEIEVFESDGVTPAKVNVTKVEYVNWAESSAYKETDFVVGDGSNRTIDGYGKITIPPVKTDGWYSLRIQVERWNAPSDKDFIHGWFHIVSPSIMITFPYGGEILSGKIDVQASVYNDPSGEIKRVDFYYLDGEETYIGNDTYGEDGWSYPWSTWEVPNGDYRIKVYAKNSTGSIIASDETSIFTVYNEVPPAATFSGIYKDYGIDEDGDGKWEYLAVEVGIDLSSPGYYHIIGWLYDHESIAYDSTYLYLNNSSFVILKFDGKQIRKMKVDGPYELRYLYLYDENLEILDYVSYAYETGPYNYTDFAPLPAQFTGIYSDYGVDVDGDGLFDYLRIEVGVNVTLEGNYWINGKLVDADGVVVETLSNSTYLTEESMVYLDFSGRTIYMNGVNGSYTLERLDLYSYTTHEWLDYAYRAHTTSFYNFSEFGPPESQEGILKFEWAYRFQPGHTRMQFGSSPTIADLIPGGDLEIITGSDEYVNYYPELGKYANGIWRVFNSNGSIAWARDTETDESRTSVAVVDLNLDGSLEIVGGTTSGWNVEVIDSSGDFLWTFPWPPSPGGSFLWHSSPAVGDLINDTGLEGPEVVIGNNPYGSVWAFDGDNSDMMNDGISAYLGWYPGDAGTEGTDWDVLWTYQTEGNIISTPAIGDVDQDGYLEIVIGSLDGKLYVLNGTDGNLEWSFQTGGAIYSSAGLADLDYDGLIDVIVVGSTDGKLYVLNGSGSSIANFSLGSIYSSPAIGDVDEDGEVEFIVGSMDGKIYSVSLSGIEWSYPTDAPIYSSPAIANRSESFGIYIGSDDGYLYLLNGTGSMIDRFRASGAIHTSPSIADIDGDSYLEIIFVDWHAPDYMWVLEDEGSFVFPYEMEWPTFRYDPARGGSYE